MLVKIRANYSRGWKTLYLNPSTRLGMQQVLRAISMILQREYPRTSYRTGRDCEAASTYGATVTHNGFSAPTLYLQSGGGNSLPHENENSYQKSVDFKNVSMMGWVGFFTITLLTFILATVAWVLRKVAHKTYYPLLTLVVFKTVDKSGVDLNRSVGLDALRSVFRGTYPVTLRAQYDRRNKLPEASSYIDQSFGCSWKHVTLNMELISVDCTATAGADTYAQIPVISLSLWFRLFLEIRIGSLFSKQCHWVLMLDGDRLTKCWDLRFLSKKTAVYKRSDTCIVGCGVRHQKGCETTGRQTSLGQCNYGTVNLPYKETAKDFGLLSAMQTNSQEFLFVLSNRCGFTWSLQCGLKRQNSELVKPKERARAHVREIEVLTRMQRTTARIEVRYATLTRGVFKSNGSKKMWAVIVPNILRAMALNNVNAFSVYGAMSDFHRESSNEIDKPHLVFHCHLYLARLGIWQPQALLFLVAHPNVVINTSRTANRKWNVNESSNEQLESKRRMAGYFNYGLFMLAEATAVKGQRGQPVPTIVTFSWAVFHNSGALLPCDALDIFFSSCHLRKTKLNPINQGLPLGKWGMGFAYSSLESLGSLFQHAENKRDLGHFHQSYFGGRHLFDVSRKSLTRKQLASVGVESKGANRYDGIRRHQLTFVLTGNLGVISLPVWTTRPFFGSKFRLINKNNGLAVRCGLEAWNAIKTEVLSGCLGSRLNHQNTSKAKGAFGLPFVFKA